MEKLGLDRDDVATKTRISASGVWRILVGDRGAGRKASIAFEKALGIPIGDWGRPPVRPFTLPAARLAA